MKLVDDLTLTENQLGSSATSGSFGGCGAARLGLLAALWFNLGHGGGRTAPGDCYLRAGLTYGARYRGDSCRRRTRPWRVRAGYELGETSDEWARAVSEGERARAGDAKRLSGLRLQACSLATRAGPLRSEQRGNWAVRGEKEERAARRGKEQAGAGLPAATGQKREEEFFSILFPNSNPNANPIKFEHSLKYIFLLK